MFKLLQKHGLPLGFLAIAVAAAVLSFLRPDLLAGGLLGAFFGGSAAFAAALAVYVLLFKLVGGISGYPALPLLSTIGYVVAASVLVVAFTSAERDPGVGAVVTIAAPVTGVLMFLAALWFNREQAA